MKYSKEREQCLKNSCDYIKRYFNLDVEVLFKENRHVIVIGNGNESVYPYNYDCANGILQGIVKIMQLERGRK
jgi:hypothetical protein